MLKTKPKLSVAICTFNRAKNLRDCLESLARQTLNPADFEVMVVCPKTDQESRKVVEGYSGRLSLEIIPDPEKGLAAARDLGWRRAKSGLVAWIDDDVVVSSGWAESILKTFEENPAVAGVSGPTIIPQQFLKNRDIFWFYNKKGVAGFLGKIWAQLFLDDKPFEIGKLFKSGAWSPGSNFPESLETKDLKAVDYLEACNMTLRRNLVEKAGGFDLNFRGTAEWCEIDLAQKVKKLGYKLVFNPEAIVYHHISQAGAFAKRTKAKERMENFFRFYFRHVFKPSLEHILKFSAYVLFLNFYWTYKAAQTKNLDWLSGWLGTITGLRFILSKNRGE